jgi:hypothetical protein
MIGGKLARIPSSTESGYQLDGSGHLLGSQLGEFELIVE